MKVFRSLAIFAMATGLAASLFGQAESGNLYIRVADESGAALPGVGVTLSGCGAPRSTTTGGQGEARYLNLAPCSYTVKTELSGFATIERTNVVVNVGTNTELSIAMKIASVATTVTVTSESPLLDTRKASTGANYNQSELNHIPTGRDPWVMIQQVPGVQIDRLNSGGDQSGQQSAYVGKGTDTSQNSFNMDGVTFTDMASLGSSATYYDFDQFQEIQVSTGGSDPSLSVPGVTLNMVTKRGTNDVHGSGRDYYTPGELQATNAPKELKNQANAGLYGPAINSSNINQKIDRICTLGCKGGDAGIQDYGVEAGGPLWADKAWLWGSYGRKEIPVVRLGGTTDTTFLNNYAGKLSVQPVESNSFTFFYFRGGKDKLGRSAGVTRPQETSVDQTGPTDIYKGEDSQVFGPNLVADVAWSYTSGGFSLSPEGGQLPPNENVYEDPNGVFHRSFAFQVFNRPQHEANGTASAFFNTGALGHELKFGFGYRKAPISSSRFYPGNDILGDEKHNVASIYRPRVFRATYNYYDGFIGDTITANNLTVNVGLRYDYQYGTNDPTIVPGNVAFPALVPGINYPGQSAEFKWKNFEPRVGITYGLGAARTTLLRASYARYADQLGASDASWDSPLGGLSGVKCGWVDANGDNNVDPGEVNLASCAGIGGFDPANPQAIGSTFTVSRNLKAPITDEFTVGVDHQILPEFVAGLTYTYRHRTRILWSPLIGVTAADYATSTTGPQGFDWAGNPIGTPPTVFGTTAFGAGFNGGMAAENRPGYAQNYNGIELQLTKRLSDRWMAHGAFTWNDWKQKVDNKATGCIDPTAQLLPNGNYSGAGLVAFLGPPFGPTCGNGYVYNESVGSGSFGNVWISSKWNFNVSALYQLPWNFNLAANFFGRQGYMNPYFVTVDTGNGQLGRDVLVGNPDSFRSGNVYELDMRLEKVIPVFQKADVTLSMDVFNLLNSNTVLQRENDATPSCDANGQNCTGIANKIYEIQTARTLRFGARLSF